MPEVRGAVPKRLTQPFLPVDSRLELGCDRYPLLGEAQDEVNEAFPFPQWHLVGKVGHVGLG